MKKLGVAIVISLFLIGFVMASMTSKAVSNDNGNNNPNTGNVQNSREENENQIQTTNNQGDETELETQNRVKNKLKNKLNNEQIKKIFTVKNRINNAIANGECPEKCTCTGSVTKCQLQNGTREMTIRAGNSGNMIMQVKGINATTRIILYKSEDGRLYGIFKNNETKIVKMLPNQVRERIKERLKKQLENENITLNENGTYDYDGEKKAKLFFIIPVKVLVQAEIDPETGKVLEIKNSWWSFLAKDDNEEQIVGASCGTVTPGQNDACCKNKEYDFWNATATECQFNSSK